MEISTITSKGQITIPARLRRDLGLKEGDKILLHKNTGGSVIMRRFSPEDEAWMMSVEAMAPEWDSPEDDIFNELAD